MSALVLWCTFVGLYLGGAVMLLIGLYLACGDWWAAIHHQSSRLAIGTKTAELFVLALGLILVVIVPFLERQSADRSRAWKAGRRSESKRQPRSPGEDCVPIR